MEIRNKQIKQILPFIHLKQILSFIGRFSCLPVSILKQCDDKRNLAIAVMSLIFVKNNN